MFLNLILRSLLLHSELPLSAEQQSLPCRLDFSSPGSVRMRKPEVLVVPFSGRTQPFDTSPQYCVVVVVIVIIIIVIFHWPFSSLLFFCQTLVSIERRISMPLFSQGLATRAKRGKKNGQARSSRAWNIFTRRSISGTSRAWNGGKIVGSQWVRACWLWLSNTKFSSFQVRQLSTNEYIYLFWIKNHCRKKVINLKLLNIDLQMTFVKIK